MATTTVSKLIRKYFFAYETKDKDALQDLLRDDFTFTSPRDEHISKAAYFKKCWPISVKVRTFQIEKLFAKGSEAFVRYRCELKDGTRFRNTEYFRSERGKIKEVDVYFGRDLKE